MFEERQPSLVSRRTARVTCRRLAAGLLALAAGVHGTGEAATPRTDRGECQQLRQVASFSPADIDRMVAGLGAEAQLFANARCSVTLARMVYLTVAPDGSSTPASAGVAIPVDCGGDPPVVEYLHGTWPTTGLAMSDPTQQVVQEALGQFAGQGYAMVMPDYLGYGASSLNWHPYLQADNSADVAMDAMRAARSCDQIGSLMGGRLFLAGTSEGGYVAMATLRAMEAQGAGEFEIAGAVATSGPYALADTTLEMIQDNDGIPGYALMQLQGYQNTWGDIYRRTTDVFQTPWANQRGFTRLLPNRQTLEQLTQEHRLPPNLEGQKGLLTQDFVQRYQKNPQEPARVHAQQNDLRNFEPKAPLSLCYGSPDTHAAENAHLAYDWFASQGVGVVLADVQQMVQYAGYIRQMGGRNYHSDVEAPVCLAWTRQYAFDPNR